MFIKFSNHGHYFNIHIREALQELNLEEHSCIQKHWSNIILYFFLLGLPPDVKILHISKSCHEGILFVEF